MRTITSRQMVRIEGVVASLNGPNNFASEGVHRLYVSTHRKVGHDIMK